MRLISSMLCNKDWKRIDIVSDMKEMHCTEQHFLVNCVCWLSAQMQREALQSKKTGWLIVHNTATTQILAVWAPGSGIQFPLLLQDIISVHHCGKLNLCHSVYHQHDHSQRYRDSMRHEKHEQCIGLPKTNLGIFGESNPWSLYDFILWETTACFMDFIARNIYRW